MIRTSARRSASQKAAFPAIVAGDGGVTTGRAAFAYYGTTTDGTDTDPSFPGVWYLYISSTFDGGQTWTTVNATPGDPIQRGGICGDGDCRNMLDFFDAGIDKEGRVLVGWDDGCVRRLRERTAELLYRGRNDHTAERRQAHVRRLRSGGAAELPDAPALTGSQIDRVVNLSTGAAGRWWRADQRVPPLPP